jgi:hypothetical protein
VSEVVSWLEAGPDPAVDGVVRWRRQDLRARIAAAFGVECQRRCKFPQKCRSKIPHFGGAGDQPVSVIGSSIL